MILEREDYPGQNTNSYGDSSFQWWNQPRYQFEAMGYHHNGYQGFNALFFDGHVRFYDFDRQPLDQNDGDLTVDNWR